MTCDAALGLYPRTDGGTGCFMHVVAHAPDPWQTPAVLVVGLALGLLAAIFVIVGFRRV